MTLAIVVDTWGWDNFPLLKLYPSIYSLGKALKPVCALLRENRETKIKKEMVT